MATAAALKGHGQKDKTKCFRADPTRLAKRLAETQEPKPCPLQRGLDTPGKRNKSDVTSSPTAYAMYLSTTDYTGITQKTRITPPSGYSNTNCCAAPPGPPKPPPHRVLSNDVPVAGGCCIYRGRGQKPVKKLGPQQLSQFSMGPTPNRMQRIGNVKPRSSDTTAQAIRVGQPVTVNNLQVADGMVTPTLGSTGDYIQYLKESSVDCNGSESGITDQPWQKWPVVLKGEGRRTIVSQSLQPWCDYNAPQKDLRFRLATAAQPPVRCSPKRIALEANGGYRNGF